MIGVGKNALARGDVLALPRSIEPARRIDATVRVLSSASQPVRHGAELLLHSGTVEVGCRVIVLDWDEVAPGARGWVQLYMERPIAAAQHDRFVLPVPRPSLTVPSGASLAIAHLSLPP